MERRALGRAALAWKLASTLPWSLVSLARAQAPAWPTRALKLVVPYPAGGNADTFINRFHIVATAGGPTFYVKETVHVTVSPTGEIRAAVDFASEQCV